MNAQRRKEISKLINKIEEIQQQLKVISDEEQKYFDSLPEHIQYNKHGEKIEDYISSIDLAISYMEGATSYLQDCEK